MLNYFEDLCSISKHEAKYFQNDELIRGSNTNNYVEAQFLVIKDSLLKRRKNQYNIDVLLDKVIGEFEDLYKHRLLSVAVLLMEPLMGLRVNSLKELNTSLLEAIRTFY